MGGYWWFVGKALGLEDICFDEGGDGLSCDGFGGGWYVWVLVKGVIIQD